MFSVLRVIMKKNVKERTPDVQMIPNVIVDKAKLSEPVHEKLTRERVVPTISAKVPDSVWGPTFPIRLLYQTAPLTERTRASRFSLELKS